MKKFNLGNKLAAMLFIAFSFACVNSTQAQQKCGTDLLHNQLYDSDADYRQFYDDYKNKLDSMNIVVRDSELHKNAGSKFIPVAVHYQYTPANATEEACLIALAQDQVNILNEAYGAESCLGTTGLSCFDFCIATKNHPAAAGIDNGVPAVTFGGDYTCGNVVAPCANPVWNGYLNISVITAPGAGGTLGVAFRPSNPQGNNTTGITSCAFASGAAGCIIDDFVGSASCAPIASSNLGYTVVHEVGHMLGLRHVFCCGAFQNNSGSIPAGGCCENAAVCGGGCMTTACDCDELADTPPQADNASGCPGGSADGTAPNPSVPGTNYEFSNYMDYVNDACMDCFSDDQYEMMHNTYDIFDGYFTKDQVCTTIACEISNVTVGDPECTPFGNSFTVEVSWFGSDDDVTISGGAGASPASVSASSGSPAKFTYGVGAAAGPITFDSDCAAIGPFELVVPNCVEPVPTMGEWGIMILGLLLVIFGVVAVRQYSLRTKTAQ